MTDDPNSRSDGQPGPPQPPDATPGMPNVPAPPSGQPLPPPPPTPPGPPQPDSPTVVGVPPAYMPPPPSYTPPPPGPGGYQPAPPGYPPPPPNYPTQPPPAYGTPPPNYGGPQYQYNPPPPPSNGGPSAILIGLLALLFVVIVGVGAMYALNIGPFAPAATPTAQPTVPPPSATPLPSPTPAPSATPAPTETPAPSANPTETPSVGPSDTPPPSGDLGAQLLSHIPTALAPSCFTTPGAAPILALATCTADAGAIEVTYFLYDSQEAMFQAYEGFRRISGIEPSTGTCTDAATWPTENSYTIGGESVGRWLCTEAIGATTIYWTDDRLVILSQATHTDADHARLIDFWVNESGPIF